MTIITFTKKRIEAIEPSSKTQVFNDSKITGLHLRVYSSGKKVFYLYFRTQSGEQRRPKIGDATSISVETARNQARVILGEVSKGLDPVNHQRTSNLSLRNFCKIFDEKHLSKHVKPSTARTYRSLISSVILPSVGSKRIELIKRSDVEAMLNRKGTQPTSANHALALLRLIIKKAQQWEYVPEFQNPCLNIQKFKTETKERFLSGSDRIALSHILQKFEKKKLAPINAITIIRLLMLTGCRKNEIVKLHWGEVRIEEGVLRLRDSKTGRKDVILSQEAIQLLRGIKRTDSLYVFPGKNEEAPLKGLQKIWERIRKEAGLEDVRLHDLRHTFASVAVSHGIPLYEVGRLLGHASIQSTQRYAHLERERLYDSLSRFSSKLTV